MYITRTYGDGGHRRRRRRVRTTCARDRRILVRVRRDKHIRYVDGVRCGGRQRWFRRYARVRSLGSRPVATPYDDSARASPQCRHSFVFWIGIIPSARSARSSLSLSLVTLPPPPPSGRPSVRHRRRRRYYSRAVDTHTHHLRNPLHIAAASRFGIARVRFIIIITITTIIHNNIPLYIHTNNIRVGTYTVV